MALYKNYYVFPYELKPIYPATYNLSTNYVLLGRDWQKRRRYLFDRSKQILEFEYVFTNLQDVWGLKQFFYDRKGRYEPFWLRGYKTQTQTTTSATTTSTNITVVYNYEDYYVDNYVLHIYIPSIDFYAKVISYTKGVNDITLGLDTALPVDLPANSDIEYVYFVRFGSDTLELEFRRLWVAEGKLSFKWLVEESP